MTAAALEGALSRSRTAVEAKRGTIDRSTGLRLGGLFIAVLAAMHFSLASLAWGWRYSDPLSELVLVPLIGAGLFIAAALRHGQVGKQRLTTLDHAVAVFFAVPAVLLLAIAPATAGNLYWAQRLDMLAVPLVAAAITVLLFGTRSLVAFAVPLGYLFLAWPLPYTSFLGPLTGWLTGLTGGAVRGILHVVPIAAPVGGGDGLTVALGSGDSTFHVNVASACAGVDGIFGFGVIAVAMLYFSQGSMLRRFAWLASGLVAVWVGNVVRLMLIFGAVRAWGAPATMDFLHPIIGIIMLNLVFRLLLRSRHRFGVALRPLRERRASDNPLAQAAPRERRPGRAQFIRRGAMVAVFAAGIGLLDAQLAPSAFAFDNHGMPAAVPFGAVASATPAFTVQRVDSFDWARAYYGSDAKWVRYKLTPTSPAPGYSMWADSIVTSDLAALRAHPVVTCYHWHGYNVLLQRKVILAGGVIAQQLVYVNRSAHATWHVLTWEWPVTVGTGDTPGVRYERVTLLASTSSDAVLPVSGKAAADPTVTGAVLGALNELKPGNDPKPALTSAMTSAANAIVNEHVGVAAATDLG